LPSTPGKEGSPFTRRLKQRAQQTRELYVKCPFCHGMILMIDDNIKWPKKKDKLEIWSEKLAWYECQLCKAKWTDLDRNHAVSNCEWRAEKEVNNLISVAWRLPAWNSPLVSLSEIALDIIEKEDDPSKEFGYVTQRQAKAFKAVVGKKKEGDILSHRCEFPPKECPNETELITIGIDMQHKSFWYSVHAWAKNRTTWMIDYAKIRTWEELAAICFLSEYTKPNAQKLNIWRGLLDTGGTKDKDSFISRTEEAYKWLRENGKNRIWGYKGSNRAQDKNVVQKIMDTYPSSNRRIPGGLVLIKVNPDAMKDNVQAALFREEGQSGQLFLHSETGMDFAKQFIAQELRKDKFGKTSWVTTHKDDHLKDCTNMNYACVDDTWIPSFSMVVNFKNKPKRQPKIRKSNNKIEPRQRRFGG